MHWKFIWGSLKIQLIFLKFHEYLVNLIPCVFQNKINQQKNRLEVPWKHLSSLQPQPWPPPWPRPTATLILIININILTCFQTLPPHRRWRGFHRPTQFWQQLQLVTMVSQVGYLIKISKVYYN